MIGTRWRNKKNGNVYTVKEILPFRCSTDRAYEGLPLVVYQNEDGERSARLKEEFLEKFNPVPEEEWIKQNNHRHWRCASHLLVYNITPAFPNTPYEPEWILDWAVAHPGNSPGVDINNPPIAWANEMIANGMV